MYQVVNAQFLQLQHHRAKVGAQDLRVRVVMHLVLVRLLCKRERERKEEEGVMLYTCKCNMCFEGESSDQCRVGSTSRGVFCQLCPPSAAH